MFGAGLQLQQVTPGISNTGNAHVSGRIIADSGMSAPGGYGALTTNNIEQFGRDHSFAPQIADSIIMGRNIQLPGVATVNFRYIFGDDISVGNAGTLTPGNIFVFGQNSSIFTNGSSGGSGGRVIAIGVNSLQMAAVNQTLTSTIVMEGTNNALTIDTTLTAAGQALQCSFLLGSNWTKTLANFILIGNEDGSGTIANKDFIQIGNTLQTTVRIGAYTFTNGDGAAWRGVADANDTIKVNDRNVAYTTLTAARTEQLPLANTVKAGFTCLVYDQSGNASAVNTISILRAGADTINNGAGPAVINSAFGGKELMADGISKWTIIRSF